MIRDFFGISALEGAHVLHLSPLSTSLGFPFPLLALYMCRRGPYFRKNCRGGSKIVAKYKIWGVGRGVSNFLADNKGRHAKNAGV